MGDGVYENGSRIAIGSCPNRLVVTNRATVRSQNGPTNCVIRGAGPVGATGVRCVYLGEGSMLEGITLSGGATLAAAGHDSDVEGAGVWAEPGGMLSNCVIASCSAGMRGGGARGGALYQCRVVSNSVIRSTDDKDYGGGVYKSRIFGCVIGWNDAVFGGGGCAQAAGEFNTIMHNRAYNAGGCHSCNLRQSLVSGNEGSYMAGGTAFGSLDSCVVVKNRAMEAGGIFETYAFNSIIYYNDAITDEKNWTQDETEYWSVPMDRTCTTPMPRWGAGNMTNEPGIVGARNPHLVASSSCRGAGAVASWMTDAVDWDGEPRAHEGSVDIGCDQFYPAAITGALSLAVNAQAERVVKGTALHFESLIEGRVDSYTWSFGDGSSHASNQFEVAHSFDAAGVYDVVLAAWNMDGAHSVTVTVTVLDGFTNYVSVSGGNVWPYTNWANAARIPQDAADANQVRGGVILFGPGTYTTGGRTEENRSLTNRIILDSGMIARSSDGPGATILEGVRATGPGAVRCARLKDGAEMHGFTLRYGGTGAAGDWHETSGGGVMGEAGTLVSNCVIRDCSAHTEGGGAMLTTLRNSQLIANYAPQGGGSIYCDAYASIFLSNTGGLGGAAYGGSWHSCTGASNVATNKGGALHSTWATDSLLLGNQSFSQGGGAQFAKLLSCRLLSNSAAYGGGAYDSVASNTVFEGNGATGHGGGAYNGEFHNCRFQGNTSTVAGAAAAVKLYDCELTENSAPYAGAIYESYAERCVFRGNNSSRLGAVWRGTNRSCWFVANHCNSDGGAGHETVMENCTIIGNTTHASGGGVSLSIARNSIIRYNNNGATEDNYFDSRLERCSTWPLPSSGVNFDAPPGIVGWNNPRLLSNSPCINAGARADWMESATDLYGFPRISGGGVAIGCSEYVASTRTGALSVAAGVFPARVVAGNPVQLTASIEGQPAALLWEFDGAGTDPDNFHPEFVFTEAGEYDVVLTVWNTDDWLTTTVRVFVAGGYTNYVSPSGGNVAPYTNWTTAARSIQDAIRANDIAGGVVLVAAGTYDSGSVTVTNSLANRVAITNPVIVRSVSGPGSTVIKGRGPIGALGIRCVYMGPGAQLDGFTLTNGNTRLFGDPETELRGGGAWCDPSALITNCVITDCSASSRGGGVYRGRVKNSTLRNNTVVWYGGGASHAELEDCVIEDNRADLGGGGCYESSAKRCVIRRNRAIGDHGGGSYDSSLQNCVIYSNQTEYGGGADFRGALRHCTVYGNQARSGGEGTLDSSVRNGIVYYNKSDSGWNNIQHGTFGSTRYTCTEPAKDGTGNITNAPLFVALASGDVRLATNSPCMDAADPVLLCADDITRMPRPLDGNNDGIALPDMGAYEYLNELADSDGDLFLDGDEIVAGTSPVDSSSFLAFEALHVAPADIQMSWMGMSGRLYSIETATNLLSAAWLPVPGQQDIPGSGALLSVTNASDDVPVLFYRMNVRKQ